MIKKTLAACALVGAMLFGGAAVPAQAAPTYPQFRCAMVEPTRLAKGKYRMAVNTTYHTRRGDFYYVLTTRDWKGKKRVYRYINHPRSIVKTGIEGTPLKLEGRQAAWLGQVSYDGQPCWTWNR